MNRRQFIAGATATATAGGAAIALSGGAAAETEATYEIHDDPHVESADGDVTFVALEDGEVSVTWSGHATDVEYVRSHKHVSIEETDSDEEVNADYSTSKEGVTGTNLEAADESGSEGSWTLEWGDPVTIVEGDAYDDRFASPPEHDPIETDALDVPDEEERSRVFEIEITHEFTLYDESEAELDSATASDTFELTVTNEESEADVDGESTATAE